jgi:hypothetical protein
MNALLTIDVEDVASVKLVEMLNEFSDALMRQNLNMAEVSLQLQPDDDIPAASPKPATVDDSTF